MEAREPTVAGIAPLPLAMLAAQAERQPGREALRTCRHGQWQALSWSQLARRVASAAAAWAGIGVARGDTIVALGPLSESFVVTLLAVQSIGARLAVAEGEALDAALAQARFVLAYGTQEVDRVLAQRTAPLPALIVENAFGAEPAAGSALVEWAQLLASPAGHDASRLHSGHGDDVAVVCGTSGATAALTARELAAHPADAPASIALAEFPNHWLQGLRWLNGNWLIQGAALVLAEPGRVAGAALLTSGADLWLASTATLAAFDAELHLRMPHGSVARHAVRAALGERGGLLAGALWRPRLRHVLGLGRVQRLLTERQAAARVGLQRLGIAVVDDALSSSPTELPRTPAPRPASRAEAIETLQPLLGRVAS